MGGGGESNDLLTQEREAKRAKLKESNADAYIQQDSGAEGQKVISSTSQVCQASASVHSLPSILTKSLLSRAFMQAKLTCERHSVSIVACTKICTAILWDAE